MNRLSPDGRLKDDLTMLTKRHEYGEWFRLTALTCGWFDEPPLTHPTLLIKFFDRWYPIQLDLSVYPYHVRGMFHCVPPCPMHRNSPHPDFYRGIIDCEIESRWQIGDSLFEGYISPIYNRLNHPSQHLSCEKSKARSS